MSTSHAAHEFDYNDIILEQCSMSYEYQYDEMTQCQQQEANPRHRTRECERIFTYHNGQVFR
jgi:hypothetical protein